MELLVRRVSWIAVALGFTFFFYFGAYVCDDAFISFRSIDNFVHGHGLRWNGSERVQVFTHPLWALLLSLPYWIASDPGPLPTPGRMYWTVIAVSYGVSLASLLAVARAPRNPWLVLPAFLLLMSSQAFVTFTSSGLETPLSFLLVALFYTRFLWRSEESARDLVWLGLFASLAVVNRLDTALLFVPACASLGIEAVRRLGVKPLVAPVLIASVPIALWFTFALVYFGFLLPNSYFAKLGLDVERTTLIDMATAYFSISWRTDPVTLGMLTLGTVLGSGDRRSALAMAGGLLYVGYVGWIGGDFLGYRFLAAPYLISTLVLLRYFDARELPNAPALCAGAAATLLLYGAITEASPLRAWRDLPVPLDVRFYYEASNPSRWQPGHGFPFRLYGPVDTETKCQRMRSENRPGTYQSGGGLRGFCVGPEIALLEPSGIMDPLLARLPFEVDGHFLPGHISKPLPAGYYASLVRSGNRILDPELARYWDKVRIITRGPLFTRRRWAAIFELNFTSSRRYRESYRPEIPPYAPQFSVRLPSLVDQLQVFRAGEHPERLIGGGQSDRESNFEKLAPPR